MATQKRYFDYGSRIRSKNSAEPFGLINGIGPIFGFDIASISLDNTKITISSSNNNSNKSLNKYRYISDENGNMQIPNHLVIHTDGIITALYGDIELDKPESSDNEYMVIATHNYTESSDIESPTIINLIPNNTGIKFRDIVNIDGTTISTWYDTIKTWDNSFNQGLSVILAFIDISESSPKVYNPYNNTWPLGSNNYGGSGIESMYYYEGTGDSVLEIKDLNDIEFYGLTKGSDVKLINHALLASVTNQDKYKSLNLEILKLKSGLWSLKGRLIYNLKVGNQSIESLPIIKCDSTSSGKNDYNTILPYFNTLLRNIGIKIKNYKELFKLTDSDNLAILSQNFAIDASNIGISLPIGGKLITTCNDYSSSDLSLDMVISLDPFTSMVIYQSNLSSTNQYVEVYFNITLKKISL